MSSEQLGRLGDRLSALEADLAHRSAASDAMSSIIDQASLPSSSHVASDDMLDIILRLKAEP